MPNTGSTHSAVVNGGVGTASGRASSISTPSTSSGVATPRQTITDVNGAAHIDSIAEDGYAHTRAANAQLQKEQDEADADVDQSIRPLCRRLAAQIEGFLDEEPKSEMTRKVQEQTRVALGVIATALDRYR
jgi:hypothetical protein